MDLSREILEIVLRFLGGGCDEKAFQDGEG
jgi:hypothetical protein